MENVFLKQHIHILGICGTFMGSLARLAKASGFKVTGCDAGVYPPMSTQLEAAGIELTQGFAADQIELTPDLYVVGNVVSRGNPLMEAIMDAGLPFTSGPQWFAENILAGRWVLGVSGTHGKTTTTSMLSWILEYAGFEPGFLVGGVPENFGVSARLGGSDFFVVEADEYDTAFFDKRSKFVHYRPHTLVINNLEFDHADIFDDLGAIQKQFHHLIRTVPGNGLVIAPGSSEAIIGVLNQGCWSERHCSGAREFEWYGEPRDFGFDLYFVGEHIASVTWSLSGLHNIQNAVHAIAAARHIGIAPELSAEALTHFKGVKRRMERIGEHGRISVYDDFAHHPTAIASTLEGLRKQVGADAHIVAVIEPRSNTMKRGVHKDSLLTACEQANALLWYQGDELNWSLDDYVARGDGSSEVFSCYEQLIEAALRSISDGDDSKSVHVVVMSNGGFGAMPTRLLSAIQANG